MIFRYLHPFLISFKIIDFYKIRYKEKHKNFLFYIIIIYIVLLINQSKVYCTLAFVSVEEQRNKILNKFYTNNFINPKIYFIIYSHCSKVCQLQLLLWKTKKRLLLQPKNSILFVCLLYSTILQHMINFEI